MSDHLDDQKQSRGLGYAKPPHSARFKKGQSGNPNGRPKGSRIKDLPFEAVLGRKVTIRDQGEEREVTAAEAFLLHLAKQGLAGGPRQTKIALIAITQGRQSKRASRGHKVISVKITLVSPKSLNLALIPLRMAIKRDRFSSSARMLLEPWLVRAALERFGEKRLTKDEQQTVLQVTRNPDKVSWPDWWLALPPQGSAAEGQ